MSALAHDPHANPPPQAGEGEKSAGRVCPLDYVYRPSVLARAPDFSCGVLYVAGGLYGNLEAMAAIKAMAAVENAELVFNGDFHWLDAEPGWFADIERGVSPHRALRGNVETEISRIEDIGAGCGCDYPETVSEDVVQRSNATLLQLRDVTPPAARARLRPLPMHLVAQVGGLRVGIVHGDAQSLAGWHFAQSALDDQRERAWRDDIASASRIDVFASTHTCEAALRDFTLPPRRLTVVNNGAAGMPNFAGTHFGIITRIATTLPPQRPLYGLARSGVRVDALPVVYDHDAFAARFLRRWPQGSTAYESYWQRIDRGPDYMLAQAAPR
jgi:hypothetical protein